MIKKIVLAIVSFLLLGYQAAHSQCVNDTVFTDVIYLIDNSGSIDDSEFVSFSNIITTSIADLQNSCADAQVAVAHYGGFEGKGTIIEHPFSMGVPISSVNRQFCLARNGSGNCSDGGGDDLNFAIGNIIDSLDSGVLTHDTSNNLSIVILTDAFGFDTNCNFPFCSLILPTTNIDILKSQYGVDVTVVGISAQAEETALALYASPGGTYNGGLFAPACPTSFDGCTLPRKYVEVEFNSDPDSVAAIVTSFVSCSIIINTGLVAEAGPNQSICSDLSQSATLTAVGSMGALPYNYSWSTGATSASITVSPTDTTTYFVTISDANLCMEIDSVTVYAAPCCDNFMVSAGSDTTICSSMGSSASLVATASGGIAPVSFSWDNGLGGGQNQTVNPAVTTTYTVVATDNIGCTDTDQITVTVEACCAGFSVSAGADRSICTDLGETTTLNATPTGGSAPIAYSWSTGATTAAITVSPNDTTAYFVTITDADFCTAMASVTVYAAPCCDNLMVTAGMDTTICVDPNAAATLMATATGSGMPFSFSWDNGLGVGANQTVNPTATTTYTVTVLDNIGCTDTDQVTVVVEDCCTGFTVSAGADRIICGDLGESTTLTSSISGGVGPFLTVWDNGIGVTNNPIVMPSVTTTYTVTVTDANGCITTDQVTIGVAMCAPDCEPDTTFTDVIFLIDNSGSIDDGEFAQFENIIVAALGEIRNSCSASRRSVVHYGGANGTNTSVEFAFGQVPEITSIDRQYCNDRTASNICVGGGGDDLNNAIGDIMTFLQDGSLNRDPRNNLSLVILTDAFGFDTNCQQPNCSLILPITNIDALKANFDADVSVVGVSSQAEESLLGIYASPGGNFNSPLFQAECASSFDGCQLPRKYVQIEFNTPPSQVADMITDFVSCQVEIRPAVLVDAGVDQMICSNLGESASLTATGSFGTPPYLYQWNEGLGTMRTVTVAPTVATDYIVTVTDANMCTFMDTVTVSPQMCFVCEVDAGDPLPPTDICIQDGQAFLPTESNVGTVIPMGFEEVFFLTNSDLKIIDYSIGFRNFIVTEPGLYRIHTLIAEVSNPLSEDFFDLNIIEPGISDLFIIVNCITNHDICADFDYPGRVIEVLGEDEMMCMDMENTINLCWDGFDNDGDGLVDCADPDCVAFITCQENTLLACNDLTDNDGDGLVDCFDSDCFGFTLCFERGDACSDGIDNDGDGLVDCADSSCDGAAACMEDSPFTCVDGRDNDGDGLVDCADPDCQSFIVCAEYSDTACMDGIDNDFDGLVDCKDPDCRAILPVFCEPFENTVFKCQDGRDNDDDGLVDCADPDCQTAQLVELMANLDRILEVTNATCNGGDDGIIRFFGIATDPNFQYSIDGGLTFISSTQFTALAPRAYVVAVKSALGCVQFIDINLERDACAEICNNNIDDDGDGLVDCQDDGCTTVDPHNATIINMRPSECPDFNNGSFEVAGLPSDVMFTLDGVNFQSSPIFSGLAPLAYNLGYKDANGCYPGIIVTVEGSPDADEDGICDALDTCPGEDDWIIGTACDDGDPCTINDIYNTVCDCVGTMEDSDGDGVCNTMDQCPTGDDSLIGTACDDGDPCTINDVYTTDCNCAGVFSDSDGDGVCDAEDACPSGDDTLIGTACDDGNDCTINDAFTAACNCEGIFQDSDGDGTCDADDNCVGGDDSLIGTACDDGDPCTINDTYTTACNCEGVVQDSDGDGICDVEDQCPSLNLAIGSPCDDNNPNTDEDIVTTDCNCVGTESTVEPVVEICNNGIDDDEDGMVDCEDSDCQSSLVVDFDIISTLCDAPVGRIEVISPVLESFSFISDVNSGNTYPIEFDSLSAGEYELYAFSGCDTSIQRFIVEEVGDCQGMLIEICDNGIDDDGDGMVDCEDGDCASFDRDGDGICDTEDACPDLNVAIGTPCDDNNPNTEGDIVTTDCNCIGTEITNEVGEEICNNGIDDDGDGLVDCNDEDCQAQATHNVTISNVLNETCDLNNGTFTGSGFPFGSMVSIDGINFQEDSIFTNLDSGSYVLTIRDADGCYVGPTVEIGFECESASAVQSSALNVSVMLQGACAPDGGPMSTALNEGGYLPGQKPATFFGVETPAGQPFDQAPWFYEGSEGSDKSNGKSNEDIYESTVVDWVLVSLRDGVKKENEVWQAAGLLHNDGYIEFFDSAMLPTDNVGGYYVVIEHRNHLPIMSPQRVSINDGMLSYDFTQQNSFTSLLGVGQIQDEFGNFMMIAGNGELVVELSSDIDINTRDLTLWIQNNGANSSYFLEDYDMNGDINIKDRIMWEKNNGLFTTLETKD